MFFRTPKFWFNKPNIVLYCFLKPLSLIYSYFASRNYKRQPKFQTDKSVVIAIGAVTVGGSGKTLVVQSICNIMEQKGYKVAVLSRGYGRKTDKCIKVNPSVHTVDDVGDEPLLLSKDYDVYVSVDRSLSARLAESHGANCLVLDDGIVQRSLYSNKKFIVVDNQQKFGNCELFPLGPNRLDINIAFSDCDAVFVLGKDTNLDLSWLDAGENTPVLAGTICANFPKINGNVVAFCGIGFPDKFFNSLSNYNVVETIVFPDHYHYSDTDVERLLEISKSKNARLITTEKDFVRISKKYREYIYTVPVKIIWEKEQDLHELLKCNTFLTYG